MPLLRACVYLNAPLFKKKTTTMHVFFPDPTTPIECVSLSTYEKHFISRIHTTCRIHSFFLFLRYKKQGNIVK